MYKDAYQSQLASIESIVSNAGVLTCHIKIFGIDKEVMYILMEKCLMYFLKNFLNLEFTDGSIYVM